MAREKANSASNTAFGLHAQIKTSNIVTLFHPNDLVLHCSHFWYRSPELEGRAQKKVGQQNYFIVGMVLRE